MQDGKSGHHFCYVWDSSMETWVCLNDDEVYDVPFSVVKDAEDIHLLVYEVVNPVQDLLAGYKKQVLSLLPALHDGSASYASCVHSKRCDCESPQVSLTPSFVAGRRHLLLLLLLCTHLSLPLTSTCYGPVSSLQRNRYTPLPSCVANPYQKALHDFPACIIQAFIYLRGATSSHFMMHCQSAPALTAKCRHLLLLRARLRHHPWPARCQAQAGVCQRTQSRRASLTHRQLAASLQAIHSKYCRL